MNKHFQTGAEKARLHLIESAGKVSQDLGLGRIIGQVLAVIYLHDGASSLDDIGRKLSLSKAAVSIATRQLDKLGVIKQVWIKGDRKTYYRTSDHLASTLQKGIMDLLRNKLQTTGEMLKEAEMHLMSSSNNEEKIFLEQQIGRARKIHQRVDTIVNNPLMKLISG